MLGRLTHVRVERKKKFKNVIQTKTFSPPFSCKEKSQMTGPGNRFITIRVDFKKKLLEAVEALAGKGKRPGHILVIYNDYLWAFLLSSKWNVLRKATEIFNKLFSVSCPSPPRSSFVHAGGGGGNIGNSVSSFFLVWNFHLSCCFQLSHPTSPARSLSLAFFPSPPTDSGDLICILCIICLHRTSFLLLPPLFLVLAATFFISYWETKILVSHRSPSAKRKTKKLLIKNSCRAFNFVPKGMRVQNIFAATFFSSFRPETLMAGEKGGERIP